MKNMPPFGFLLFYLSLTLLLLFIKIKTDNIVDAYPNFQVKLRLLRDVCIFRPYYLL